MKRERKAPLKKHKNFETSLTSFDHGRKVGPTVMCQQSTNVHILQMPMVTPNKLVVSSQLEKRVLTFSTSLKRILLELRRRRRR